MAAGEHPVGHEKVVIDHIGAVSYDFAVHERIVPGDIHIVPFSVDADLIPGVGLNDGAVVCRAVHQELFDTCPGAQPGEGSGVAFAYGGVEEESAFFGKSGVREGIRRKIVIVVIHMNDQIVMDRPDLLIFGHGGREDVIRQRSQSFRIRILRAVFGRGAFWWSLFCPCILLYGVRGRFAGAGGGCRLLYSRRAGIRGLAGSRFRNPGTAGQEKAQKDQKEMDFFHVFHSFSVCFKK